MSKTGFLTEIPEDVRTAAVVYREAEKQAYRDGRAEARISALMAADPEIDTRIRRAFAGVAKDLHDAFVAATPKRKADAHLSPKVYEVHHTRIVAQECYLGQMVKDLDADRAPDPEAAADYTRRRLRLTGDIETFYEAAGFLPLTAEKCREFGFTAPDEPAPKLEPEMDPEP